MRLQSAIFDLDGTLLDTMPAWRASGPALLEHYGIDPSSPLSGFPRGANTQEAAAFFKKTFSMEASEAELRAWLENHMTEFYRTQAQPKPGVKKFLSLLKMEGVWMYVATATNRSMVETALKATGLDSYFRGIITSAEAGANKADSPEIFERAMRRLQSNKKDTVIFEDALHAIQTAKNAGFRVAAVYDVAGENEQEEIRAIADYYIRSFEEMFETKVPD